MKPLTDQGAIPCNEISEAIFASKFIIVYLSNYDAWTETITQNDLNQIIGNKTIIQLTTGSIQEIENQIAWSNENDVHIKLT